MRKILLTGAYPYTEEQFQMITSLGYQVIYIKNEQEKVMINTKGIQCIVCNSFFHFNDISQFADLSFIQVTSAGMDRLPIAYIKENKIVVNNARGVYNIPMAEWTVSKVLDVYKQSVVFADQQVNKEWIKQRQIRELWGKRICVVGIGSIGKTIADYFHSFGCIVTGVDLYSSAPECCNIYYNISDLNTALSNQDIVILTLPMTDRTRHLINTERLAFLKSDSILINISRGSIVSEEDIIEFARHNTEFTAILDVFEQEPLEPTSALWEMPNIMISPHNSFVSENNHNRLFNLIYNNLKTQRSLANAGDK